MFQSTCCLISTVLHGLIHMCGVVEEMTHCFDVIFADVCPKTSSFVMSVIDVLHMYLLLRYAYYCPPLFVFCFPRCVSYFLLRILPTRCEIHEVSGRWRRGRALVCSSSF